jgi:hypothetical protein
MHRLPDGSGFFVGTVGPRDPGILNWVKYRKHGSARPWLLFYRNARSAHRISRMADQGPPMTVWRCISWSWRVLP